MATYKALDKMKFQYTATPSGGKYRIEPTEILLARPGKRIIGQLNGIDEESCHIEVNLQNTAVLDFTVHRIVDGRIANFYDLIDQHFELYARGYGWFKINEEPQVDNDGYNESKTVRAESLEIELQQYDLVNFEINTGSVSAKEMLATDNTYNMFDDYKVQRGNIKFWFDSTSWDDLIQDFPENGNVQNILNLLKSDAKYQFLFDSWRICYNLDGFDDALKKIKGEFIAAGLDASAKAMDSYIGHVETQDDAFAIIQKYPQVLKYIDAVDFDLTYTDDHGEEQTGTVKEMLIRERQRFKDLSFLDLVLKETGWKVGYVDPSYDPHSDNKADQEMLKDRIGYFEVDSQDVYSFLTQDAAQYYRCVFEFDTENCTVNAYKVETIGKDTNIFLSFHNIQNSVSRNSDRQFHTVFHVANGTGDNNLDIREANFGNDAIEDISYFLNTNHFKQEMIDKYNAWKEFMESKRKDYMDLAVQYRDAVDVMQEIDKRVPVDAVDPKQYSSFTVEELAAEKENQKALIRGYQALYVDDENNFDIELLKASKDWHIYNETLNVVLSDPVDDALMIMPMDNSFLNTCVAGNDAQAKLKDLQDKKAIQQTALQRLIDKGASADEKKAVQDKIAELTAQIATAQSEVASKDSDIDSYYKNDHKYTGIVDDTTITGLMMYHKSTDRLGTIDTELFNRWLKTALTTGLPINTLEFDEDYIYDFATYGSSYGVKELEVQKKNLENLVLTEKQYLGKVDQTDEYIKKHNELLHKYQDALTACNNALTERQNEYDTAEALVTSLSNQMTDLRKAVSKEGWVGDNGEKFTEQELAILLKYCIHTDYTNENILTTEMFSNQEIVDTEYELYNDALEELYADSHPQWTFQTTQDNLLLMPELQDWHGDLEVGNFIRVGFREDDPWYIQSGNRDNQVKLRLVTIGFNPFLIEPTIDLTFSTMVQYKSKRNDFVEIIGSATGGSAKNQISSVYDGTKNHETNISADFIAKLLNSGSFASGVSSIAVGSAGGAITDALNSMDISIDQIGDLTTRLEDLVNGYVDANAIATKLLQADVGIFKDIKAGFLELNDGLMIRSNNEGGGNVLFNGSTLQFIDKDENVGIQIGYNLDLEGTEYAEYSNRPFIMINDKQGTALFTSEGLTQNAVADKFIVTRMFEEGAVDRNALAADAIKSSNYIKHYDPNSPYSFKGTYLDLYNGNFYSPSFGVINDPGDTDLEVGGYFNGTVQSNSGKIANWNISNAGIIGKDVSSVVMLRNSYVPIGTATDYTKYFSSTGCQVTVVDGGFDLVVTDVSGSVYADLDLTKCNLRTRTEYDVSINVPLDVDVVHTTTITNNAGTTYEAESYDCQRETADQKDTEAIEDTINVDPDDYASQIVDPKGFYVVYRFNISEPELGKKYSIRFDMTCDGQQAFALTDDTDIDPFNNIDLDIVFGISTTKDDVTNVPFYIKKDGYLFATYGRIGGWDIGDRSLSSEPPNTQQYILLGNGTNVNGDVLVVRTGTSDNYDYPFKLLASGKLEAKSAAIEGDITANTLTANKNGSIAGWTISSGAISKVVTKTISGANHTMQAQVRSTFYTEANTNPYDPVFWTLWDGSSTFFVRSNGEMYAKSANITGTINATSGSFGAANATSKISIGTGANASIYYNMTSLASTNNGFYIGTDGIALGGGKFKVTNAGALTATSGTIGGCTIDSSGKLQVPSTQISGRLTASQINTTGLIAENISASQITGKAITTGKFNVDSDGNVKITATNVLNDTCFTVTCQGYSSHIYPQAITLVYGSSQTTITPLSITTGGINACSSISAGNSDLTLTSNLMSVKVHGTGSNDAFIPGATDSIQLGGSNSRWSVVYAKNTTIQTSDEKDKDIYGDIYYAYDLVMNLEPIQFMWKDGDHRRYRMGFSAQETAKVCNNIGKNLALVTASYKPEVGEEENTKEYFGEDVDDELLTWGMAEGELIAPMVKVLQLQDKRIKQLENELKDLKENKL